MKEIFIGIHIISCFFVSVAVANSPQSDSTMSEYFLHPNNSVKVKVVNADSHGKIELEIHSVAKGVLRLWNEGSSWGCWKVIRIYNGSISTYYQDQDRLITALTKPDFIEVPSGGKTSVIIALNSRQWPTAAASQVRFNSGDTVIAIYEVPYSPDAEKQHVWFGVAAGYMVVP